MDRLADALIGAAATDVRDGGVDVVIVGLRVRLQQCGGGHDLAGLAVAALRHVVLQPGDLHRMAEAIGRQALDGGDLRVADRAAGTWQDRVATPSICTVQAPHCAMPQPYLVPVMPSHSRMTHSSGVSGSASTLCETPLTVSLIMASLLPEYSRCVGGREHDAMGNAIFPTHQGNRI